MTDTEHWHLNAIAREVHALARHEAETGRRLQGSTPATRWILEHPDTYRQLVALEARGLERGGFDDD